jgi:hypothetical protein
MTTGSLRLIDALSLRPVGNQAGSYVDRLEVEHKGYIALLFRQAQKEEGNKATWKEYARAMNILSAVPGDDPGDEPRPRLSLSHGQLRRWFVAHNGRTKRTVTHPILTQRHKDQRVIWCTEMRRANDEHCLKYNNGNIDQRDFKSGPPYRCFEDEKYFYTSSR